MNYNKNLIRNHCTNVYADWSTLPFKRQFHKMVKHTQTIRRQIADELFECVWQYYGIGA